MFIKTADFRFVDKDSKHAKEKVTGSFNKFRNSAEIFEEEKVFKDPLIEKINKNVYKFNRHDN
jgi:hypothetical protein